MAENDFKPAEAQRRGWRIQRTAWLVMGVVLLLALAGGLGDGWLSTARAASADGRLAVRYQRIWRVQSPQILDVRLDAGEQQPAELRLDAAFLGRAILERVTPEPERTQVGAGGLRLKFAASDSGPLAIQLELSPRGMGRLRAHLGAADGPPLVLTFLVLP